MGCGESKHDVVTGNTVSQSKRSNSDAETNKDTETISEKATNDHTTTTNSTAQQEETENAKEDSIKLVQEDESENAQEDSRDGNAEVVADTKEVNHENADSKDGGDVEEKEEEPERLMSRDSPGHFFSSRKDEETIESIISEGMSGKSEYYSPRAKEAVSKGNEKLDDTVEEKGHVEETKMETKNGEPTKVNEENLGREAEVMPTIELKDSATGGDEKAGANEEHLTDSSTKDSKSTN